jgi:hypothetical protein
VRAQNLSPGELEQLYQHMNWGLFVQAERDTATVEMARRVPREEVRSIADLSAGGANITPQIANHFGVTPVLGDLGRQYGYEISGELSQTLPTIEPVDLYVCSETIEHLEDPDSDLALIRSKTRYLVLTTPIAETWPVSHGHLWTWERPDVEAMIDASGFKTVDYEGVVLLDDGRYFFGVWLCN